MYHFHHTEAIVIATRPLKESDRRLRLFTRELGVVTATATGVRLLQSKLRYALQPYTLVTLVMVHGKQGWRVTNAVPKASLFVKEGREKSRRTIISLLGFIARFLPEGVAERNLFDFVCASCRHILDGTIVEEDEMVVRLICEYKTLYTCGYIATPAAFQSLLRIEAPSDALSFAAPIKKHLHDAVVQGVTASHL